jgi:hypothetical protein
VNQDGDAVATGCGLLGDVREDDRLAAAGGQDEQDGAVAALERMADVPNGAALIPTKFKATH